MSHIVPTKSELVELLVRNLKTVNSVLVEHGVHTQAELDAFIDGQKTEFELSTFEHLQMLVRKNLLCAVSKEEFFREMAERVVNHMRSAA